MKGRHVYSSCQRMKRKTDRSSQTRRVTEETRNPPDGDQTHRRGRADTRAARSGRSAVPFHSRTRPRPREQWHGRPCCGRHLRRQEGSGRARPGPGCRVPSRARRGAGRRRAPGSGDGAACLAVASKGTHLSVPTLWSTNPLPA